jgi:hypothetical protein
MLASLICCVFQLIRCVHFIGVPSDTYWCVFGSDDVAKAWHGPHIINGEHVTVMPAAVLYANQVRDQARTHI